MDISSPVTGAAMDLFTSPTYTLATDQPADTNQKAWYVSAVGGTQPGVDQHSAGNPFQVILTRPKNIKLPNAQVLATQGQLGSAPVNEYKLTVRKGTDINIVGGTSRVLCELRFVIPSNSPEVAPHDIQAALSLLCGIITQDPTDFWDVASTGSI